MRSCGTELSRESPLFGIWTWIVGTQPAVIFQGSGWKANENSERCQHAVQRGRRVPGCPCCRQRLKQQPWPGGWEGERGGESLTGTWRRAAAGMSCHFSGSSALPPFSSESSRKEISQSVKHNNYIPSKASESGTCSTRISSPPLLDHNRRFGRISYSEAISQCGERGMQDALADLQKNYCFFHSRFLPPVSLVQGLGAAEAFYLKTGA